MATRATIRFATREEGVSFNKHPERWQAQFYRHWDGYPEGLGVEIAESFTKYGKLTNWEVESLNVSHTDIEYMYYIWQSHEKSEPWISIFKVASWEEEQCIFVGTPDMLLDKFAPEQIETEEFLCNSCDCSEVERDICTN